MAGRELELSLKIKGALESSYPESLRQALSQTKSLERKYGDLAKNLKQQQKLSGVNGNNKYLQEQIKLAEKLGSLHATKGQSEEFAALKRAQRNNNQEYKQQQKKVAELAVQYKQAQQSMSHLKNKQSEVKSAFEQSQRTTDNLRNKLQGLKSIQAGLKNDNKAMVQSN